MLYLFVLLCFFMTCARTQVSINHEQISQVKRANTGSTARIECKVDSDAYVHWYVQRPNEGLKRILHVKGNKKTYDAGFTDSKYKVEYRADNIYVLDIVKLAAEDEGTYYCAAWQLPSHTDTKPQEACTENKSPQEPAVTVLATSKEVVKDIGSATLLCSLQNFFPEAIQVMWTEVGRSEELKSEQGELVKDASTNMSSLYSWITIRQTDIGKIFRCKYKHEGNGNRWREVEYNTASLKDTNQYEITNSSCMDTADLTDGVDVGPMIVVRAAQLIYALLLLKCLLYCPFLLLFRYKSSK